jgi:hypothetical protein
MVYYDLACDILICEANDIFYNDTLENRIFQKNET